jgi:hypothetical protein
MRRRAGVCVDVGKRPLGGLLGLGIDVLTRYGYDLEPEEIRYELVRKAGGSSPP